VHLLKLVVGMSEGLLEYLVDVVGARGIVLETLGGGRVPPWWLPTIERAVKSGVAIVIASRAGAGRTVDRYGYTGARREWNFRFQTAKRPLGIADCQFNQSEI
jgi:L-asparaginase